MTKLIIAFFILIASFAFPQKTDEETDLQTFYRNPSSERLIKIINKLDNDSLFLKSSSQTPIIGFLTVAFSNFKEDSIKFKKIIENLKTGEEVVKQSLLLSNKPDFIINYEGIGPSINDLMWGAYFASGEIKYLDRIINVLVYSDSKDLQLMLAGETAKWSLCANAKNYSEVNKHLLDFSKTNIAMRGYIKEILESEPGILRKNMESKIQKFNEKEESENDNLVEIQEYENNELRIMNVLVNDENVISGWNNSKEIPKIIPVEKYKRGENVIPLIIFTTNGMDDKGNANLTYDILIKKPDGSVYGEFKQLVVWQDAPTSDNLQLVQQPISIRIEEKDPLGIYTIHTIVYEINKKEKAEFNLSFEVIE